MRSRVAVYAVLLVAGLSVLRAPASAQKTGQTSPSPTTPSPSPTTPGTRTPVPTSPGTQQPSTSNQQGTMQDLQRPIFLNGKVLVEDGTPPPESVLIERVCNGVARPQGYTDSKGRFSFQLGQDNMMFADASVGTEDLDRRPRHRGAVVGGKLLDRLERRLDLGDLGRRGRADGFDRASK